MKKLLTSLTSILVLCCCTLFVTAQTYNECGFAGPSNPATEPAPATNPAYPAAQVICADGSFPECSSPADAGGATDFAGDCGSANYDFVITNPQDVATGDGGAAVVGVDADGAFDPSDPDGDPVTPFAFAVGESACVTGFCYDLIQLQDLVNEINANGSACSAAESIAGVPVCPIPVPSSLQDLFSLAGSLGGGGSVSVGDVVALLPQLDQLGALGITNVPACGLLSGGDTAAGANQADYCMEVVDCSVEGSPCDDTPPPMAGCTALAGEPLVTPEEVCDTDAGAFDVSAAFDPAMGSYDDGAGNVDPVNTNYVAVDQATGAILGVATSAATLDLSGAPVGTVACVYQLAYTQGLLDDVTTFLDDLLCNTLCVPITGPCLGDVGYCPGVTPVELAPFLDILNQFFGFDEAAICNFLDNQIITIPDPTGLIGDQVIDLAANGLDFCADKSDAPYCVEIISCMNDACTAMAGEAMAGAPTVACNDAASPIDANTIFDPAMGGYDNDGDGVVDDPVSTNYVAVDANGDIISVSAAGASTLDLSSLADGETACIYQLAYTQGTLDAVTGFVDNLLCNTLCVPITGPCLGDVGYCPGVTPVEFAPFLDLLNTFFGFNETQICNFIDNQIITITDPTGLIGDQMIDLAANGLDFCVDKSEPYCVTIDASTCPQVADACTAMAGEAMAGAPTEVCNDAAEPVDANTIFDPASGGYDSDGDGVVDAMVSTNYIAVDANGDIVAVTAAGASTLDLSALADGETACIYQLAYTQGTLDAVTTFLDDLLCNTLCVPITGPCLGDVGYCPGVTPVEFAPFLDLLNSFFGFNETQICNFIDNQIITITDPTGLIGDQMIDLVALGIDFCVDKSNVYCVTATSTACTGSEPCEADAPEIDPAVGDCAADDGDMMETPFTWPLNAASTENTTAPYITEYIVVDAASGTIIGVFPTLAAAEAAANTEITADVDGNATACIQAINHEGLTDIIADVDGQTGGLLCNAGIVTCPVNELSVLYTALAGAGAVLTVADVIALIGPPNTGVMGFDLGALIGLPPGALIVDIPPFCYETGAEICATNMACGVMIMGCTDPCADNYDATATMDDGSCEAYDMTCNTDCNAGPFGGTWDAASCACINEEAPVLGCTDTNADNYDPAANCDDGGCIDPIDCSFSVGVSAFDCNNGGTMENPDDDTADITFVVMSNGATWTSDVAIGGVMAGGDGMMLTEMGVPAGTVITVTFTSDDDPDCTFVLDYTVPDCTVQIPTLSQWGLMSLALMLMIFGALKLSTNVNLSYRKG